VTIEEIRQLIALVQETAIAELEICRGDDRIRIVRQHGAQAPVVMTSAPMMPSAVPAPVAPEKPARSDLYEITAPMVGTFYRAPAPDAPPYVNAGDHIEKDQVICIIEAMKLMNEIPAGRAGTVVEIAVENAQPVEFGQVLVRIKPD